jgi:hypothetical protein
MQEQQYWMGEPAHVATLSEAARKRRGVTVRTLAGPESPQKVVEAAATVIATGPMLGSPILEPQPPRGLSTRTGAEITPLTPPKARLDAIQDRIQGRGHLAVEVTFTARSPEQAQDRLHEFSCRLSDLRHGNL